jgi:hypothetical protein
MLAGHATESWRPSPAVVLAELAGRIQALGGMGRGMRMFTTTSSGVCSATRVRSWAASPAWPTTWNPERSSRLASPSRSTTSSSASTTRAWEGCCCHRCASDRAVVVTNGKIGWHRSVGALRAGGGGSHGGSAVVPPDPGHVPEAQVTGGLSRRMAVASGLLALTVGTAFAVLLVSVADLRTAARLARHSEEVLAAANQLERLVIDLETGQRGFVFTAQEQQFLQPWRDAQVALPGAARTLERLTVVAEQHRRAQRITQAATSYLQDYSVPLVAAAPRRPGLGTHGGCHRGGQAAGRRDPSRLRRFDGRRAWPGGVPTGPLGCSRASGDPRGLGRPCRLGRADLGVRGLPDPGDRGASSPGGDDGGPVGRR